MCNIRVTEGKIENLKTEVKTRVSTLIFIYTIHFAYLKVNTKGVHALTGPSPRIKKWSGGGNHRVPTAREGESTRGDPPLSR